MGVMAKISANGATIAAQWRITLDEGVEMPGGGVMDYTSRYLYTLRTDGVLLRRLVSVDDHNVGSGYKVVGRFVATKDVAAQVERVTVYLLRRFPATSITKVR